MTNTQELQQLTRWCSARQLLWQPSRTETGLPAILLRPHAKQRPWQDMLLVEDDDGVTLMDETGEMLASASEIPALLDALDSGLVTNRHALEAADLAAIPSYAGVFSEMRWNNVGVGIT